MPRTLIIDDEPPACEILRALLAEHPQVTVAATAGTVSSARTLLARDDYDLVFLDVQLRGGTGFDLVQHVQPGAKIIFVTAHDQHAFRAFEVNALDYLLKPVAPERLAASLRRAHTALPQAVPPLRPDDLVQVKTAPGAARFVRVADILLVTSQDNYSEVSLTGGERLFVRQTMATWEERLPASHFLRVHRQTIVNIADIAGYSHQDDRITLLQVAGISEPVRARRQHWQELCTRLATLGRKF